MRDEARARTGERRGIAPWRVMLRCIWATLIVIALERSYERWVGAPGMAGLIIALIAMAVAWMLITRAGRNAQSAGER